MSTYTFVTNAQLEVVLNILMNIPFIQSPRYDFTLICGLDVSYVLSF